ncbi:unnamed protein product [Brassica oleracea var. botrytis]
MVDPNWWRFDSKKKSLGRKKRKKNGFDKRGEMVTSH